MAQQPDYYQTLGIEKSASKDEIKKAFRKLAAQYHPDKKTGDEAKFKEISEAYAVLGDDTKRAEYDAYGHAFAGAGGGTGSGFGGFDFSGFQQAGGQGFSFDINDIFEQFGDAFGGGGQRQRRGHDISIDINLSFKEAVFGVTRTVRITKQSECEYCNGTGAKDGTEMVTCSTCNGQSKVRETRQSIMGTFQTVKVCDTCMGSGKVPKEKCDHCACLGVRRKEEEIEIQVPAGIQDGEVIRMTGRGEAIPGGAPGDLYIKLHVETSQTIKREGNNLIAELPVKLTDALLGNEYNVETLDGSVTIKVPAGVRHHELLRIKGKGVPTGQTTRGDFLVKIDIQTPNKLSRKAKKLVEELRSEGI
jgi:molecular chaperone DnaJ